MRACLALNAHPPGFGVLSVKVCVDVIPTSWRRLRLYTICNSLGLYNWSGMTLYKLVKGLNTVMHYQVQLACVLLGTGLTPVPATIY